jgi:hypothetical protein
VYGACTMFEEISKYVEGNYRGTRTSKTSRRVRWDIKDFILRKIF